MQDSHAGSTAAPGALIAGRYRIESLLGRGGMAAVYRATDESLGRTVALKLFPSESTDASAIGRESSEIRLLASMNHHALVTLFDASVDATGDAERAFLVMELVEGPTLQKRIEQGPIPATEVALMATDLAEALHVVHAQGVVHRDIKPANILLSPALYPGREFRAKLADFGIAYLIDSTRLTTPGTLIGTAAYLSPEQANGSAPGPAADIYSLGLVLLEALTGVRAFPGTMVESLTARLMRSPEIPGALGYEWKSLLTAMTAMDPASRPSALDVVDVARRLGSDPATGAASTAFLAAATAAQTGTVAMEPPTPDTTTEQHRPRCSPPNSTPRQPRRRSPRRQCLHRQTPPRRRNGSRPRRRPAQHPPAPIAPRPGELSTSAPTHPAAGPSAA
jgi:serine/threonine protein kinase